jgi:hypothetical protein
MYILGDASCASKIQLWDDVVGILTNRGQIGPTLRLQCPRHKETHIVISKPTDFETLAPEGGCTQRCGKRLSCGHSCEFMCHSDQRHLVIPCQKPCERGRTDCGHACPKRCSDPCGDCDILVPDVLLPCGHRAKQLECVLSRNLADPRIKCRRKVNRKLLTCGHTVEMYCYNDPSRHRCEEKCAGSLECSHGTCSRPCWQCSATENEPVDSRSHKPCLKPCGKDFTTCSHRCQRTCHRASDSDCGSCRAPCVVRCIHSQCRAKCGEDCVPCAESCNWNCQHRGKCSLPCGAPCDRLPCNERC